MTRSIESKPPTPNAMLAAIVKWARARPDIRGVALVGSRARGTARENSDIDIILLADVPATYRTDTEWLEAIDWPIGAHRTEWSDEEYGVVWSRRIRLSPGLEFEITFAPVSWACVSPVDPGTCRVIADGCRIFFDPGNYFGRLAEAIGIETADRE